VAILLCHDTTREGVKVFRDSILFSLIEVLLPLWMLKTEEEETGSTD